MQPQSLAAGYGPIEEISAARHYTCPSQERCESQSPVVRERAF
jgi:hypothetical protein